MTSANDRVDTSRQHPGRQFAALYRSRIPRSPTRAARRTASRIRSRDPDRVCPSRRHRNGRDYRDYWLDLVDEAGILAISIEFPEPSFPEYLWYHFGNLHAKDGTPNPREAWTFGIDGRLFEELRAQGVTTLEGYGLFGHSAGGQFVHRMLSFGFRDRVVIAVSANAGTYAMPDLATPWPFGLGNTDVDTEALRALLAFPITVMAGTEDVLTTGRFFPKGPALDAPRCQPLSARPSLCPLRTHRGGGAADELRVVGHRRARRRP